MSVDGTGSCFIDAINGTMSSRAMLPIRGKLDSSRAPLSGRACRSSVTGVDSTADMDRAATVDGVGMSPMDAVEAFLVGFC